MNTVHNLMFADSRNLEKIDNNTIDLVVKIGRAHV